MRVVHFAHINGIGGSGRSASRIHHGLQRLGVDSRMLVERLGTPDAHVRALHDNAPLWHRLDKYGRKVSNRLSLQDVIVPSSYGVVQRHAWVQAADVVGVFNTWNGFLSYMALPGLSARKPLVWRLSDEWLYTGHCVYTYDCDRWLTGCGACPQVHGERPLRADTSALLWRLKRGAYRRSNLHIVAPSRWIADRARRSPLIGHFPVTVIPNGVDDAVFGAVSRGAARALLGVAPDEQVILFAAQHLDTGRKGGHLLWAALEQSGLSGTLMLLGGSLDKPPATPSGWKPHMLGYIDDDSRMAAAYAAADVFVLPSLADNLPNTVLESMAAGTPVVALDVGGVSDAVRHMETGYLAPDAAGLVDGLRLLLADVTLCHRLGETARAVAHAEYTLDREAQAFYTLYQSLIQEESDV